MGENNTKDLKGDLIQLFKNSCEDMKISRNKHNIRIDVDYDTRHDIFKALFPKDIKVLNQDSFTQCEQNIGTYHTGFKFSDNPPLGISGISQTYGVKYGILIPFISLLFLNNYKRRKAYKIFCDTLIKFDPTKWTYWYCRYEKRFKLTLKKKFIVHGTLFAEISKVEYAELIKLYNSKVEEYDKHKLKTRLRR
jgi:hypothetical protein